MDLPPAPAHPPRTDLVCSARACRAPARWALRWNNPRLHTPERRKTWLACPEHLPTLSEFLRSRAFLRETVPVVGPETTGRDATDTRTSGRTESSE